MAPDKRWNPSQGDGAPDWQRTGGSWALTAALGLTALGNFVNLYSLKKNKRKEE